MKGTIAGAFGKLDRDKNTDEIICWHSLIDHMTDVAACFERLSACRSLRRAMEAAAGRVLHENDIARLSVLVFLHDMGKANSGFQAKRWKNPQDIPRGWPRHAGHGIEALKLFEIEAMLTLLPVEQMDAWGHACYSLLIAGISHHGRPLKDSPGDWNKNIWKPVADAYDPAAELRGISQRVMAIYPQAFIAGSEPLPDAPAFGHLFAGMVQLADWLGSSTVFFPYSEAGEDRAVEAGKLADKAIATIGLDAEEYRDRLNASAPTFFEAFGIAAPHPMQTAMADDTIRPLAILESETGSGKTEAALWRYVHLFRAGLVDSLYFALPTRVAASQVYQRVKNTVERLWPENPPLTVRALSGYASADGAAAHYLPGFEVQWSDNPEDAQAERRWAAESAKRFLAAPLAVGTIDQALLGALQVRHAHLRYAMLARSLLVVDEVHASDPYMTVLLERLLKAHLSNGGHALLLFATLGSSARSRYLALAAASSQPRAGISFEDACRVPYPAISERAVKAGAATKKVAWKACDIIDQPDKIARLALDAASRGAKVLVICNTVPDAIAVFSAIEENIPDKSWLFAVNHIATLHHSRFSRQDRPVMDKAIEAQLGKQRPTGACIVVGTQTLEQSLDIDADLLITDLCPMDVLLQRIGRLHRHVNPRPEGFQRRKPGCSPRPGMTSTR